MTREQSTDDVERAELLKEAAGVVFSDIQPYIMPAVGFYVLSSCFLVLYQSNPRARTDFPNWMLYPGIAIGTLLLVIVIVAVVGGYIASVRERATNN